jgi:hypothetical protein
MPGTEARVESSIPVIENPPPFFSMRTLAVVSM